MGDLKKLKLSAEGLEILYVEDNKALRENAAELLNKFFDVVDTAEDGQVGLDLFKEHHYQIVITDIKMPNMDGMELAQHIKDMDLDTKVIVMSAFDDREFLYSSIELGVFRYLKKPVNISEFTDVLDSCISAIKKEQDAQLFNTHLQNVFNYQSSIVVMIKDAKPSFVNQMFLDYFKVDNLDMFVEKYHDLGNLFLTHDGFLYNKANRSWFDEVSSNAQKLYNIKMIDKDENFKHFILKYQKIPDEESCGILSFDDVTELNLLKLYDKSQLSKDESDQDSKAMYKLLEVIQRNSAKIELHNYYKGLSITHDAVIVDIKDKAVILKTDYMQEKAIQFDQRSFITSDALPNVIACDKVMKINFEKGSVEFSNLHFTLKSPVHRKLLRVEPEQKHTVSIFVDDSKLHTQMSIEDISLEAISINLETMPAGLKVDDEVVINMVLTIDEKPTIINTKAIIFKITENKRSFSIVFMVKFEKGKKKELASYMTSRQMAIIREFKGIQNG